MGRKQRGLEKDNFKALWDTRLTDLACNMFEWKNLPEEINKGAMEKIIMLGGYGIFFKDLDKYFCLPGAVTGIDVYGYPVKATPVPKNGYRFKMRTINKDCVLIYANRTRTSANIYIDDFADRLAELDVAIKMNIKAMKHPINIKASEQSKSSLETIFKQYDDDYYMIMTDKAINLDDSLEAINFGVSAKEILDLQKQKETIINEFYNLFGIAGSTEKRERIITGEINATMQQVGINRQMWLSTRQEACEHINKIFGLNISVEATESEDLQPSNNAMPELNKVNKDKKTSKKKEVK